MCWEAACPRATLLREGRECSEQGQPGAPEPHEKAPAPPHQPALTPFLVLSIKRLLMSQADKMTADEVWPAAPLPSPRGEGGAPGVSWLEAHAEPEGLQRRG